MSAFHFFPLVSVLESLDDGEESSCRALQFVLLFEYTNLCQEQLLAFVEGFLFLDCLLNL